MVYADGRKGSGTYSTHGCMHQHSFNSLDFKDQVRVYMIALYSIYYSLGTQDLIAYLGIIYRIAARESIVRDYSYSSQLTSATKPLTQHLHQRQSWELFILAPTQPLPSLWLTSIYSATRVYMGGA